MRLEKDNYGPLILVEKTRNKTRNEISDILKWSIGLTNRKTDKALNDNQEKYNGKIDAFVSYLTKNNKPFFCF